MQYRPGRPAEICSADPEAQPRVQCRPERPAEICTADLEGLAGGEAESNHGANAGMGSRVGCWSESAIGLIWVGRSLVKGMTLHTCSM